MRATIDQAKQTITSSNSKITATDHIEQSGTEDPASMIRNNIMAKLDLSLKSAEASQRPRNRESKSPIALYYERQMASMSVQKLKEMPSTLVCKVDNPASNQNNSLSQTRKGVDEKNNSLVTSTKEQSLSPMRAMQITKPAE